MKLACMLGKISRQKHNYITFSEDLMKISAEIDEENSDQ